MEDIAEMEALEQMNRQKEQQEKEQQNNHQ